MKKLVLTIFIPFLLLAAFQYLYVGSSKDLPQKETFEIIAHRGVHHDFYRNNLDNNTCTASRIYRPTHSYIENTIDSIQAAFEYGATIVEIDVRPTKDKQLVVFHDHGLECRTNGKGKVWDNSLTELKKLDLGYGYTYDDGKTYPFRGKAIGKIKTLIEVLKQFPDKKFLIDNKSGNDQDVAQLIVETLLAIPEDQQQNIYLWTSDETYEYIRNAVPAITRLLEPRHRQKDFFKAYILSLGLGAVDNKYKTKGLGLPVEYTKYIWGWPYRFLKKIYDAEARFYVFVNTEDDFKQISGIPLDGIITDHIEVLGPHL